MLSVLMTDHQKETVLLPDDLYRAAYNLTEPISVQQELFIEMIAKHAMDYAQKGRRKTLQRKDLGNFC